jgi:hypothetical protein
MGSMNYNNAIYWVSSYVQIVVHNLNDRFPCPPIFNVAKLFSPHKYPNDDSDQITNTETHLKRILLKFQYTKEESDMCKRELLEFMATLRHECENKTIFKVWRICGSDLKWHMNWPKLMQLWQKTILIPSSIAICERRYSKQNAIKSHLLNMLNLKTLDAFMRVCLCGLEMDAMDWATIFNIQRNMRDRRVLTLS